MKYLMNVKRVMFGVLAAGLLAGCSSENEELPDADLNEIRFTSNISASVDETRGAGVINKDYNQTLAFSMARIDQSIADGTYPADYSASTALNATRTGGAGYQNVTLAIKQYYLTHTDYYKTKFVAWYPQEELVGGAATFSIDGSTDIMLSDEVEGWKIDGNKFSDPDKGFTLRHKLTQIQLSAYFTDIAAEASWGKMLSVSIKEQYPTCRIKLPATVTFEGTPANLPLVSKKVSDNTPIVYPLTLSLQEAAQTECGYAMIPSVGASGKITLIVNTEKGGIKEIDLNAQGYGESMAYKVSLKFTAAEIVTQAQIGEWIVGGGQIVEL
ncbi:fimbrillin family protein [Bacteroides sp. OttesenSCG-928-F21]|nr:fimbrillin family protein [Bacteroides sp. OttesenSCG-928-F21]